MCLLRGVIRVFVMCLFILACALSAPLNALSLRRIEREKVRAIAMALQERWPDKAWGSPSVVLLDRIMKPSELTEGAVHCSDFGIQFVTGRKQPFVFDIVYRPHLEGQPEAQCGRWEIYPSRAAVELAPPDLRELGADYARSPWRHDPSWDEEFHREVWVSSVRLWFYRLSIPVGVALAFVVACLFTRTLRRSKPDATVWPDFTAASLSLPILLVLDSTQGPLPAYTVFPYCAYLAPIAAVMLAGIGRVLIWEVITHRR